MIYIDRIRNCHILSPEMIQNIETFDKEDCVEIIEEQNKMLTTLLEFI